MTDTLFVSTVCFKVVSLLGVAKVDVSLLGMCEAVLAGLLGSQSSSGGANVAACGGDQQTGQPWHLLHKIRGALALGLRSEGQGRDAAWKAAGEMLAHTALAGEGPACGSM